MQLIKYNIFKLFVFITIRIKKIHNSITLFKMTCQVIFMQANYLSIKLSIIKFM